MTNLELSHTCAMENLKEICTKYKTQQYPEEIFWLLSKISKVDSVIEIGVSTGSIAMWSYIIPNGGFYIGVDTQAVSFPAKEYLKDKQIDIITGDSHSEKIIQSVKTALQGREVDLLFIDGDHSYNGVKADYENYKQFVRKGGFIAFHDYTPTYQVFQFFNELKGKKESFRTQGGIGLLWM